MRGASLAGLTVMMALSGLVTQAQAKESGVRGVTGLEISAQKQQKPSPQKRTTKKRTTERNRQARQPRAYYPDPRSDPRSPYYLRPGVVPSFGYVGPPGYAGEYAWRRSIGQCVIHLGYGRWASCDAR